MATHQRGYVKAEGKKWKGYYKVKVAGAWTKRSKILGPRSSMSKQEAKDALVEHIQGPIADTSGARMKFKAAVERYVGMKSSDWSAANKATTVSLFRTTITPALGDMRVDQVLPSDVKALFNKAATSASQLNKTVLYTRAVFDMLIEDGLLTRNPARSKSASRPATPKPSGAYLTLPQVKALLAAADGRDYLILRIMLSVALRPSEVFALRVNDIEPGRLRIDEAATDGNGLKGTKTEGSDGYVPLSPELENLLRLHSAGIGENDLLFPSSAGTPMSVSNYLERNFQPICERAGLGHVTLQCLRRTVATHLQHHGAIKSAQGLLRHANAGTTLKHYQKTIDADVAKAAESWDDEIGAR